MPWHFVGRTEQVERIRATVARAHAGPLLITGEPGVGRTTALRRALAQVDDPDLEVIHLHPDGGLVPFGLVLPHLPEDFVTTEPLGVAVRKAVDAFLDRVEGRRVVLVVDDAHRADHAGMLVVRDLHRRGDVLPIITRPTGVSPAPGPDPLDCLRYERDFQILCLPPLNTDEVGAVLGGVLGGRVHRATVEALHAVTGGNPRALHDLVGERLADDVVLDGGVWRFNPCRTGGRAGFAAEGITALVETTHRAWRELALDRAEELCCLARWSGAEDRVAEVLAGVLLLRGRAGEALEFLDSLGRDEPTWSRVAPVRALVLALGLGRPEEAGELLRLAGGTNLQRRRHLLAVRAWLLAVTGSPTEAFASLDALDRGGSDHEAALFTRAARAAVELAVGSPAIAVSHLRRALIAVRAQRDDVPWMEPYLTACLIDALLLAGRLTEATAVAGDFHGGKRDNAWNVAVTLTELVGHRMPIAGGAVELAS
ncbi:ATP-binding protein [Saccharothrix sp. BKS2]|uniref:AAA family ATPase n=1 Tax=Saccharothrix sp. BKS2 TaxID=3064400 RepID=UPI0039E9E234